MLQPTIRNLPADPTQTARRFANDRRHAFTMLELLLVIGIILVLVTMFIAGLSSVTNNAKIRSTKAALETAKTLFANYQEATRLTRNPAIPANSQNTIGWSNPIVATNPSYWTTAYELSASTNASGATTGVITPDALLLKLTPSQSPSRSSTYPYGLPTAVADTELVLQTFLSVPDNQKILNNLPIGQSLTDATTGFPLLLDGWGNPLIFVPALGLTGVTLSSGASTYSNTATYSRGQSVTYLGGGSPSVIVYTWVNNTPGSPGPTPTSASPYTDITYSNGTPPWTGNWGGVTSPGLQPFWASAGPDGDISKGDDNIYSFQN